MIVEKAGKVFQNGTRPGKKTLHLHHAFIIALNLLSQYDVLMVNPNLSAYKHLEPFKILIKVLNKTVFSISIYYNVV